MHKYTLRIEKICEFSLMATFMILTNKVNVNKCANKTIKCPNKILQTLS